MSSSFVLFLVAGLAAGAEKYPRPELLREPAELSRPEVARVTRILDARSNARYRAGHIPGAVWVDVADWARAFNTEKEHPAWARRIGKLGIKADTPVVVYDDVRTNNAARIWWILRYWGVRDVRLLNGGWVGWLAAGGKTTREEQDVKGAFPELTAQPGRLATKSDLVTALNQKLKDKDKDKKLQIIDARSEGEFCGSDARAKRGGSVPGAAHLEWSDLLDKKTQRFKPPEELRRLFKEAGIDVNRPAATYCQSGGRAAVMAFALELMGGKDVRNYYRSWAEWGNADDTPVARPKPKK
jgi:thiosulfate/3-mercaptopyruvate sulfurtransferase